METLLFETKRTLNIPLYYQYLQKSAEKDIDSTFVIVFHIRDCRNGKGERELGRKGFVWLFLNYPDKFMAVLPYIHQYGRWDDYFYLFPQVLPLENATFLRNNFCTRSCLDLEKLREYQNNIVNFISTQLVMDKFNMNTKRPCSLLAKWIPSENSSLDKHYNVYETICNSLRRTPRQLRKYYISPLRRYLQVTETILCEKKWHTLDYDTIPSVALRKYASAFKKHTPCRFLAWSMTNQKQPIYRDWAVILDTSPSMEPFLWMGINLAKLSKYILSYSKSPELWLDRANIADMPWEEHLDVVHVSLDCSKVICITDRDIRLGENIVLWNVKKGLFIGHKLVLESSPESVYRILLQDIDIRDPVSSTLSPYQALFNLLENTPFKTTDFLNKCQQ